MAYVRPTVEKISERLPESRVIVVFTPCQYASGRELEVAREFKGISEIVIREEYKKWMLRRILPQGIKFKERGIVIFMGGDLFHGMLLSKKLKYPAIAYTEAHAQWAKHYRFFLVPDKFTYDKFRGKRIPEAKLRIVGNLMVDSVKSRKNKEEIRKELGLTSSVVIGLMPGSRQFQTDYMVPFFINVTKLLRQKINAQFLLSLSPFMTIGKLEQSLKNSGSIVKREGRYILKTNDGIEILIIEALKEEGVHAADLVLTIPGTNTGEAAALGIPMIVLFPLNKPEVIPMEGAFDYFCRLPFCPILKRLIVYLVNKKTKFFALPNIKMGRQIVPELRGNLTPTEAAKATIELLENKDILKKMSLELKNSMGKSGASEAVVEVVKEVLS